MPKPNRHCSGKVRHRSKIDACIAADKMLDVGMNVYRCKSCHGWHIGRTRSPIRTADRIGALLARHNRRLAQRMKAREEVE